jgi:hypothetical protein
VTHLVLHIQLRENTANAEPHAAHATITKKISGRARIASTWFFGDAFPQ